MPRRRSGSRGGWRWGRRSRAAPSCAWWRATRSAWRRSGSGRRGRWRASAPPRSSRGRASRTSSPTACAGCTGETRGWSPPRAARWCAPARVGAGPDALLRAGRGAGGPLAPRLRSSAKAPTARRYLASRPVALLGYRAETAALVEPLTRLGVRTLGELAALGRDAVADRFGAPGALARRLARGEDDPLRRAPSRSAWRSRWSCGRPAPGWPWSASSACSWTACWHARSGAGGRCGR